MAHLLRMYDHLVRWGYAYANFAHDLAPRIVYALIYLIVLAPYIFSVQRKTPGWQSLDKSTADLERLG